MNDTVGAHNDLHSEQGAHQGEHPGRSRNPVIKVHDMAWLEFEKPDLARAETFAHGVRLPHRRCARPTSCSCAAPTPGRRACSSAAANAARFAGSRSRPTTRSTCCGSPRQRRRAKPLPESLGGLAVELDRPQRYPGARRRGHCTSCPSCRPRPRTCSTSARTANRDQHHPAAATSARAVQRLGHVVLQSTKYLEALNWYLDNLGMIVSDFLYFPGQREPRTDDELHPLRPRDDAGRSPHPGAGARARRTATCIRRIRSAISMRWPPAANTLREQGYFRSWGIGRHIQGSQIFDYWRDPDGFLVEHFADGDMFDNTLEPGWAPFTASGPRPVGSAGHQGLPRHPTRNALPPRSASRSSPPCATTTNSTSPASSAC